MIPSYDELLKKYSQENDIETFESWIEAPKYAHVASALRDLAQRATVKIEINVEKYILRERIFFKVSGKSNRVHAFAKTLKDSLDNYM